MMGNIFSDGGVWQVVITLLGLAALGVNVLQLLRRRTRDYGVLIVGLIAATFFTALCGYATGMYQAAVVIGENPDLVAKAFVAEGIANTVLIWAGMLCTVNTVLGAVAWHMHRRATAGRVSAAARAV